VKAARLVALVSAGATLLGTTAMPATAAVKPSTVPIVRTIGTYPTASTWLTIHRGSRTLHTWVLYPRTAPARPLPVVVFAHGWNSSPSVYAALLVAFASAGVVVVAPTSPGLARGTVIADNAAADAAQIADLPVAEAGAAAARLPVTLDPHQVVFIGHSDGGDDVATSAVNPAVRDLGVAGYVDLSGGSTSANARFLRTNVRPLLCVAAFADEYGNWARASAMYAQVRPPKALLGIGRGETHLPPFAVDSAFHRRIWQAVLEFSAWTITGDPRTWSAFVQLATAPGLSFTAASN